MSGTPESARRNGKLGGRPKITSRQKMLRDKAVGSCTAKLIDCIKFWTDCLEGKPFTYQDENGKPQTIVPTFAERIRASENLADRGGLPRRQESELSVEAVPVKLIDLTGWEDPASEAVREPESPERPN